MRRLTSVLVALIAIATLGGAAVAQPATATAGPGCGGGGRAVAGCVDHPADPGAASRGRPDRQGAHRGVPAPDRRPRRRRQLHPQGSTRGRWPRRQASDQHRREHGPRSQLEGVPGAAQGQHRHRRPAANTAGSRALLGSRPAKDAKLVRRLRSAGAVILGKANLSEWANFRGDLSTSGWSAVGGQTNNPYVLDRNPCGSSSGSGAAGGGRARPGRDRHRDRRVDRRARPGPWAWSASSRRSVSSAARASSRSPRSRTRPAR